MGKHFLQGWIVFIISSLGGYWLYKQTSFPTESIKFLTELSIQSVVASYLIFLPVFFIRIQSIYSEGVKLLAACYICLHASLSPIILEQHGMMTYTIEYVSLIGQFVLIWMGLRSSGKGWALLYIGVALIHIFFLH